MKIDKDKFPLEIDGDYISNLQVMKSAAGHYIGRSYFDTEIGAELPYSHESCYYATHVNHHVPRACLPDLLRIVRRHWNVPPLGCVDRLWLCLRILLHENPVHP